MKITKDRDNRTLRISQRTYLKKMLTQFKLTDCKLTAISINKQSLSASEDYRVSSVDVKLYQTMIDFMMYVMIKTRLNIAFTVDRLSQFNTNSTNEHMKAAKHVLQYLKRILDLNITYDDDDHLVEYTNAD